MLSTLQQSPPHKADEQQSPPHKAEHEWGGRSRVHPAVKASVLPLQRCNAAHPWIVSYLARRFAHFHALASVGDVNGTADSLRHLQETHGGLRHFAPLTIGYDSSGRPAVHSATAAATGVGGGRSSKRHGVAKVLQAAMGRFDTALSNLLAGRNLTLMVHFGEPSMHVPRSYAPATQPRLPVFAMTTRDSTSEVPVPDFTFHSHSKRLHGHVDKRAQGTGRAAVGLSRDHAHNQQAHNQAHNLAHDDSAWASVAPGLEAGAPAWGAKASTLHWRGSSRASPLHKALIPALLKGSGAAAAAGLAPSMLDVADVGARSANQWALADQCKHKFLLHLESAADGASLKYKLACGSVVIVVRSPNEEFYHHALFRHQDDNQDDPRAGSGSDPKDDPKGSGRDPKGSGRDPKGSGRDPAGGLDPKGSGLDPKGSGLDPKGSGGGPKGSGGDPIQGSGGSHVVVSVEPPPPRFFRLLEKRTEPQLRHSLLANSTLAEIGRALAFLRGNPQADAEAH